MTIPFVFTKIKWAYQEGTMWRRFHDWLDWTIAFTVPRRIALYAFVRVCSAIGDAPSDITYERAYKAWEKGAGR